MHISETLNNIFDLQLYFQWLGFCFLFAVFLVCFAYIVPRFKKHMLRKLGDFIVIFVFLALIMAFLMNIEGCEGGKSGGNGNGAEQSGNSVLAIPHNIFVDKIGTSVAIEWEQGNFKEVFSPNDMGTVITDLIEQMEADDSSSKVNLTCTEDVPLLARLAIIQKLRKTDFEVDEAN